jgi:hypothetical protein
MEGGQKTLLTFTGLLMEGVDRAQGTCGYGVLCNPEKAHPDSQGMDDTSLRRYSWRIADHSKRWETGRVPAQYSTCWLRALIRDRDYNCVPEERDNC